MKLEKFENFKQKLFESLEQQIKNVELTESFRLKIDALKIIVMTCESVFKILPQYDIPLVSIGVNPKLDALLVEFEIFTFLDICLLGAYHNTITEYTNTPIGLAMEDILIFTVASTEQHMNDKDIDEVPIYQYKIQKLLKTEFLITMFNDNKLILKTNTGRGFINLISSKE